MKHSSSHLRQYAAILTGWLWCLCAVSRPSLSDLSIRVMLSENGDARITETRHMHIDSEGTEVYVVVGHLNGSRITDLSVTDESGQNYTYIGEWDVDRSRAEKSGRCGIVTKSDGYELCWGLGDSGERTYITSYTVTNMVKRYDDADGFNYMFVAEGISPEPEHVSLVISRADGKPFVEDTAAIWGFRYDGYVYFDNGNIVAETTEPFDRHSAMIVMARFPHGFFSPEMTQGGTFEEVKERAFEGSDYIDDDDFDIVGIIIFIGIIVGLPLIFIIYLIYMWWQRRKVTKDLEWWRDIPLGGRLQEANNILNAYRYFGSDYNNLLSACILRLINIGAISIETTTGKDGKLKQNFVVHDLPDEPKQERLVGMIHDIFRQAAGDDTILEPRELRTWMQSRENQAVTDPFVQALHTQSYIYKYANDKSRQSVQQLFGLKKYLKDFSLLNERHVGELSLWKEYMIYATLFGIADQVIRDMKRINPEYFNMDDIANQMADDMTLPTIYSTFHNSTSRAWMSKAEREARASGRGGRVSFGGGGGFSGGGFGGGVR